jgi:hypothetical protein
MIPGYHGVCRHEDAQHLREKRPCRIRLSHRQRPPAPNKARGASSRGDILNDIPEPCLVTATACFSAIRPAHSVGERSVAASDNDSAMAEYSTAPSHIIGVLCNAGSLKLRMRQCHAGAVASCRAASRNSPTAASLACLHPPRRLDHESRRRGSRPIASLSPTPLSSFACHGFLEAIRKADACVSPRSQLPPL